MSEQIQANYEQLGQIATRLAAQAEAVQKVQQQLKNGVEAVKSGWNGDAFKAFEAEMHTTVEPSIDRLHAALQETSEKVKRVSETMKQAEEQASALFPV